MIDLDESASVHKLSLVFGVSPVPEAQDTALRRPVFDTTRELVRVVEFEAHTLGIPGIPGNKVGLLEYGDLLLSPRPSPAFYTVQAVSIVLASSSLQYVPDMRKYPKGCIWMDIRIHSTVWIYLSR